MVTDRSPTGTPVRLGTLTERDEALGLLESLLAECAGGLGGTVIIHGSAGLGKTTLLHTACTEAAARGFAVLRAIASPDEQDFPYAVMEQLVHVAKITCGYQGPQPQFPDHSTPGADSFEQVSPAVLRAMHEMMVELSASGPLFVCIDDLQHADWLSLQCLLYLIRRCPWTPIAIVVTQSATGTDAFLMDVAGIPRVQLVQAAPLSREGCADLIAKVAGEVSEPLASEYYAATGGNPLLLWALLDEHVTYDEPGLSTGLRLAGGELFRRAALTCVRRCGGDAVGAARAVAVLDGSESPAVLSELSGLTTRAAANAVAALTEAKLLRDGRFRHPAIQQALLDDLSCAENTQLHCQAARLLQDQGESALIVARHLLAAGPAREPWVMPVLLEAAERCLTDDHMPLAACYLQFADACCDDEKQRKIIRATLAKITWRARPEVSLSHLRDLSGAARAGDLPGHVSLDVARRLLLCGQLPEAAAIVRQVSPAHSGDDTQLAFEIQILRNWLTSTFPTVVRDLGDTLEQQFAHEKPRPDPVTGIPRLVASELLWSVLSRGGDDSVVSRAEQVLHSVRIAEDTLEALESAILALVYSDKLRSAATWCNRLLSESANRQAPVWQALLTSIAGLISLRQGDLRAAAEKSQQALSSLSAEAWGVGIGLPLATLTEAYVAMGNHERAAEIMRHPVPEAMFETRFGLHYLHARGRYLLSKRYLDAARTDFLTCGEFMDAWKMKSPLVVPWSSSVAEAWLRQGKRERAAKIAQDQLSGPGRNVPRSRGVALRVLAATQAPGKQVEILNQALETLQATEDRYEIVRTLISLSHAHQRWGDAKGARPIVRRAWNLAKECGAENLCSALLPKLVHERKPTELPGRPREDVRKTSLLSAAELRVAALAAQGFTNQEISGKLFITVSTVEQHLTRTYRKLNIKQRQELPTIFELRDLGRQIRRVILRARRSSAVSSDVCPCGNEAYPFGVVVVVISKVRPGQGMWSEHRGASGG